jgi:hypothetical protein
MKERGSWGAPVMKNAEPKKTYDGDDIRLRCLKFHRKSIGSDLSKKVGWESERGDWVEKQTGCR